ncbi:MAG: antitoxin family protein [Armatimonadota bacterium]|nr:antitoxin family protein [Armatimonadota bacterium]
MITVASFTIEAIYERGVLRPLRPLELPEHTRVRLTIEPTPVHPLTDCLGIMPTRTRRRCGGSLSRSLSGRMQYTSERGRQRNVRCHGLSCG